MKLLLCAGCNDLFNLRLQQERICSCGQTGGIYTDKSNAEYWGDKAIPLGFDNTSLVAAIRLQRVTGDRADKLGHRFNAFLIPDAASTMKKIKR
jgi:hypothetical protein